MNIHAQTNKQRDTGSGNVYGSQHKRKEEKDDTKKDNKWVGEWREISIKKSEPASNASFCVTHIDNEPHT